MAGPNALPCVTSPHSMLMTADDSLHDAISSGRPCVLFLGQESGQATVAGRSVLQRLLDRKSQPDSGTWREALAGGLSGEDIEWLTERFARTVPSEAQLQVLALPWSAVFTSSIDAGLLRRLESRGRQPEAITSVEHYPRASRSTARPPVFYTLGRSGDATEGSRPPRTLNELTRRLARHSSVLLSRMADTVTTAGLLVVDGYKAASDWLPLDYLLGAIPTDGSVRVLWLGIDATTFESSLFADLRSSGALLTDDRSLADLVADLVASGDFTPSQLPVLYEPGVISLGDGAFIEVAPALRLRVEASAAIVDDDWIKPPSPLSRGSEEDLFRTLHGGPPSTRALVEGVARGFYVVRDFEESLRSRVSHNATRPAARDAVLVLHGQSGTGKSVAMARLALLARTQLRLPVVVSSDRVPEAADVDPFCDAIDRDGFGPTLVLCDCNASLDRYFALSGSLRSRGRRHLIVGTSYRHEHVTKGNTADLIEAPESTSPKERQDLSVLVSRFAHAEESERIAVDGEHVLALLYRYISAGRPRIASGLSGEARFTEGLLRARAQRVRTRPRTQFAQKLIAAGVLAGEEQLFEAIDYAAQEGDAPGRLIDYVMAAGRVDVAVPLNLLLRALRARIDNLDYPMISELFQGLDLFRWHYGDQEKTELLVAPRLRLEAELICRRRLAGADYEMECLIDLIEAVRVRSVEGDSELRFLLDLLQKLDRDGPRSGAYALGYLKVGEALTRLRTLHALEDARLILQESKFRRAWLLSRYKDKSLVFADRDRVLNEAREAVEYAIGRIENNQLRGRRTRENLYVERASIYGFLAVGHAQAQEKPAVVWSDYLAARVAVRRAMGIAPNYFPFDVGLWTPADVFREAADDLTVGQRAELAADIYSTLDRVDPRDLSPDQRERFNIRRAKVATTLRTVIDIRLPSASRRSPFSAASGARHTAR